MHIHPVANLFPMLTELELELLAEDIQKFGQHEAIVLYKGELLDGRNRMEACRRAGVEPTFREYEGDSPVSFIIGSNLRRRHLKMAQKITIGLEIIPYYEAEATERYLARVNLGRPKKSVENVPQTFDQPIPNLEPRTPAPKSRDLAAEAVGISGKSLSVAKMIQESAPEIFEEIKAGTRSLHSGKKEVKVREDHKALVEAQEKMTVTQRESLESVCDLRVCSCAELFASGIRPDAVITDPPYPREFLPVFSELAEACAKAGVPLVAVMSGQSYLPEVMQRLCEHLTYRWTLAYLTPGGQAVQQWQVKVNTAWKPILLFGDSTEWFGDVAASKVNDNDKRFHGWGQSESGMSDLISRLTKPGQLVCDPFGGAFTTAVVSLALGRKFVGCDIDPESVSKGRLRVEGMLCLK